eukprot:410571_1
MSVDPRRPRKQSWWKKSHTRRTAPKRTRSKNPSSDSGTSSDLVRAPQDAQGNNNTQPIFPFGNENSGDILSADPERLTPRPHIANSIKSRDQIESTTRNGTQSARIASGTDGRQPSFSRREIQND